MTAADHARRPDTRRAHDHRHRRDKRTPVSAPPAVVVERLERRHGEAVVLDDVSVTVPHGATLGVIGPNGAGKTTLLRVLAGLLRAHGGSVRVLGRALPDELDRLRSSVGLLGHDALLHPELTARENLRFYARLYGVPAARVAEILDLVAMTARADEPVRTLSRGLLQRVACARVCLHRPALLLLDEPWANLDVAAAAHLRAVLARECGPTRVLVTHDLDHALAAADIVIGLRAGRCALLSAAPDGADLRAVFA